MEFAAILFMRFAMRIFSQLYSPFLSEKIRIANRIFLQANYYITGYYVNVVSFCGEGCFVYFASKQNDRSRSVGGKELKNYKGNERSEYEPKANKFLDILIFIIAILLMVDYHWIVVGYIYECNSFPIAPFIISYLFHSRNHKIQSQ